MITQRDKLWQPTPHVTIRLDFANGGQIGHGKIALLDEIARTGSVAQAARELRMSYPRALSLLEQIETTLGGPAAQRSSGGAGGGHASLTRAGRELLARYRAIESRAQALAEAAADGLDDPN
jgi:molybdate transport system regulatory protein